MVQTGSDLVQKRGSKCHFDTLHEYLWKRFNEEVHDKAGTRGTGLGLPPEEYRQNVDECEN